MRPIYQISKCLTFADIMKSASLYTTYEPSYSKCAISDADFYLHRRRVLVLPEDNPVKIGSINTFKLLTILPETRKADSVISLLQQSLQLTAEDYRNEFNQKLARFNQDSLSMTTVVRESERRKLHDLYNRAENFVEEAELTIRQRQEELLAPIHKKIREATAVVARENGYVYVLEDEAILISPPMYDLFELVKKKLGLK